MNRVLRGDIIYINLGQHPKSAVQSGVHPCLVVSNDISNKSSRLLNVCPFSRKQNIKHIPVRIIVSPEEVDGFFDMESAFMPEQIITIDKKQIINKVGHIDCDSETMQKINNALLRQLGMDIGEDMYDKVECGVRLKGLRESLGKTQRDVANDVDISVDTLRKLEQGKRSPSLAVVDLLTTYYNTTADYIISGQGASQEEVKAEKALFSFIPDDKKSVLDALAQTLKELIT